MEFTYSYLFRMISHEMKQKADQKLEQFDITNEQGHTLGYLYAHQQDGLTQNDIAKALQRTGPTVSNLLRNLERKKADLSLCRCTRYEKKEYRTDYLWD